MSRFWFLTLLVPLGYLVVASRTQPGFRGQFAVVRAGSPEGFREAVRDAGGAAAVRHGVWVDVGFILLFALVATTLLAWAGGWWWVPLVTAAVDLAEGFLLLRWVETAPSDTAAAVLAVVGWLKIALYVATLALLLVACVRGGDT